MTKAEYNKMIRECRRVYVAVNGAHDTVYIQAVKSDLLFEVDKLTDEAQEFAFNIDADNDLYIN